MSPNETTGPATKVWSNSSRSSASKTSPDYGYPRGHLGHLTPEEEAALRGFKTYLQEKGLYQPGPPPSHDDPTLLRFLRARKWIVPDAYNQFRDTEQWRKAVQLDVLYETIDVDAYEQCRKLYPQWTGRRDRRGIPLYLFELRHLDSKTISAYEKSTDHTYSKATPPPASMHTPPKLVRLFALYENLTRFAQPLCTQLTDRDHPRTPITLSTNIVDVSGVSLKQFWNLKSHMQAASQLATAHYPETLDRIFVIGAPSFFSTVWTWIKRWFDPVTVSKIFILSPAEVLPVLTSFIDPASIPRQYGGSLDFAWGQPPNIDPTIRSAADWTGAEPGFPKGPALWRPIDGGRRLECVAVGSVNKVQRCERICTLPVPFFDHPPEGGAKDAAAAGSGDAPPQAPPSAPGAAVENTAAVPAVLPVPAPAGDEFKTPLGSQDPEVVDEKKLNGDAGAPEKLGETEVVANGKPVAVS